MALISNYFYIKHKCDRVSAKGVRISLSGGIGLQVLPHRRLRKENCKAKGSLSSLGRINSKNKTEGSGEMAKCLRVSIALAEDLQPMPSIHAKAHNHP